MNEPQSFEIFLATVPGLEAVLCEEALECGFDGATAVAGGVTFQGGWRDVWRANLQLRGATRVLARIGGFMAFHLAQLDKRSRKFPFGDLLRQDVPLRVQVTTKASKIYHARAAAQRVETALTDTHGLTLDPEAELVLKVRIDDNQVLFSLDTSGESLHKRGHKEAVGKAPMRETLAALMLRQAGYTGSEPVVDPMCGSGTFPIEAAEIATGLLPGRSRSFAFQQLANYDAEAFDAMKATAPRETSAQFYGSDRDAGAVRMAQANAERAGVQGITHFANHAAGELTPPDGPAGLVIVNPPYGARIGNKKLLYPLYGTLGQTLLTRFKGWRVALVTSEPPLAKGTGLPWKPQGPAIAHGGMKVWLWQTPPLR
ncbi:THUMP domain-containing class I SAM-dependent RNA methyltransferase [Sulfitobacter donghicola]|uniref:RNA methyltransferase n=1 Tax=Sulfitobacter donghicola DSW-25 = KCTC 12864 = JCM 14565 TaxID=1300350 RepID=A0A073ICM0_9RHOB|nr:RNA methyltransferase [Sulfitobacter donghicola]KEJ88053.1 RNA methyltransferase [Sulfitobacter donghicola DSW-25 = KCTC 12864 = JCM 14565]KIN68731.1 RNA methylase family protein [Sulfitobacter donghicola DSW-25 = KCTC 12864 = JCM 14565]